MNPKITKTVLYSLTFIFASFAFYWLFSKFLPVNSSKSTANTSGSTPTTTSKTTGYLTFEGPKTAVCPINGEKFTVAEEKIWSARRPLLVMIENQTDSRPQSGLSNADIVYEAVAEGGITRFMGVFYCNAVKGSANQYDVGPVRSARTYYLDLASEYGDYPLYAHVGGANCSGGDSITNTTNCTTDKRAQALEQISKYGWTSQGTWGDLNQFSLAYKVCRREPDRTGTTKATEHTMYCSTTELWNVASARGLTNITAVNKTSWDKAFRSWSFKADDKSASSTASTISFDFWGDKSYAVSWKYDPTTNTYLRSNGSSVSIDFNTKETRSIDEHVHNLYAVIGTGDAIIFNNGQKTEATWTKTARQGRTIFKDKSGKEINFVPGQVWVEILPIGNKISYEG